MAGPYVLKGNLTLHLPKEANEVVDLFCRQSHCWQTQVSKPFLLWPLLHSNGETEAHSDLAQGHRVWKEGMMLGFQL